MKKILFTLITLLLLVSCDETISDARQESAQPQIYPDYVGVTIPVNIAPLNFCMADEQASLIDAVITDRHGHSLHSQGEESVDFDIDNWQTLLAENRGDSISVTVSFRTRFLTIGYMTVPPIYMDAVYFTLFIFLYQLVFGFPSYSFRIPHPHKIHAAFNILLPQKYRFKPLILNSEF